MQNQTEAGTRLSGRPLALVRSTWVSLVASVLVAYGVVVLEKLFTPLTICDSGCSLTPTQAATWNAAGFTPALVILFNDILSNVLMPLGFVVIAALIAWRKSDDWMALLVSFSLVALGPYLFAGANMTLSTRPGWQLLTLVLLPCTTIAFTLLFYLFPDGRLVPSWMRWIFAGYILLWFGGSLLNLGEMLAGTYRLNTLADTATIFATLPIFCGGILAQVYRYTRVSHSVQRQQTKWVVFGLAGPILTLLIWFTILAPQQNSSQAAGIAILSVSAILTLLQLAFPASLAVAILRYRLFDIDIIIRRTLIYSIITAMLALFYFGSVVVLQQILRPLIGAESDLAIIISTLAIAALFNPLRHRVQDAIDHRFYRRKYDAQQVLERFAQTARDEVELEKLTGELVNVVNETMQPASVSLWLKKTDNRNNI